jgi:hypothetical protein
MSVASLQERGWAAAIGVSLTLALVLVTAAYVIYTARLVRVTGDTRGRVQAEAQSQSARELLRSLLDSIVAISKALPLFPIDQSAAIIAPRRVDASGLKAGEDALFSQIPLLPDSLTFLAKSTWFVLSAAEVALNNLHASVEYEIVVAGKAGRVPTWEGARAVFNQHLTSFRGTTLDWESDIISGRTLREADAATTKLKEQVELYVRGET